MQPGQKEEEVEVPGELLGALIGKNVCAQQLIVTVSGITYVLSNRLILLRNFSPENRAKLFLLRKDPERCKQTRLSKNVVPQGRRAEGWN